MYMYLNAHSNNKMFRAPKMCTSSYPSLSYSEWRENLLSTARRERQTGRTFFSTSDDAVDTFALLSIGT